MIEPRSFQKVAALESCRAEDWYEKWITGDFEAFLNEITGVQGMKDIIERNRLKVSGT